MPELRVLIVDDDFTAGDALGDLLRREGYDVTVTESPVTALEKGKETDFDLLLADLKMPEMNGLELVRRFQELNPQIVPIFITGYPTLETVTEAIQLGAYDYIAKPFDRDNLRTVVAKVLQKKTLPDEGAGLTEELTQDRKGGLNTRKLLTLRNCELFATLSDDELQIMADLCQEEAYEESEVVCHQGERSEKLYVIEKGIIALNRFIGLDKQAFVTVAFLKKGEIFSWSVLIEPHVHTVSAVCCKPTRVLTMNGAELTLALQRDPRLGFEVMQRLATVLGNRIRAGYDTLESKL